MRAHVFWLLPFSVSLAIGLLLGVFAFDLLPRPTLATPPPQQPILHGADGMFRCMKEADVWVQLSTARGESTTPNDVDMWLQAWRNRGGSCD